MTDLENYKEEELTITAGKANLYGLLAFLPIGIVFGILYFMLWNDTLMKEVIKSELKASGFFLFILFIIGIVVHELIHGITWSLFAKEGFRSMKFGVIWKDLTPYCHCKEPLLVKHYMTGAIMPAIILGFIPLIISLINGHIGIFIFGMIFTMAAGGDLLIIYLLRNQPADNLVQDHPTKIGCSVYSPK